MQTSFSYQLNRKEKCYRLQDLAGQIASDLHRQQTGGILVIQLAEIKRSVPESVDALDDAFFRCVFNLSMNEPNRKYVGGIVRNLRVQGSDVEKNRRLLIDDTGHRTLLRSERIRPRERNVDDLV